MRPTRAFSIPRRFSRPGEMAERSNAAVLKTVSPQGLGGSNPSLSAKEQLRQGGVMQSLLLVALGGAAIRHHVPAWQFPAGTFAVNVLGCLVAGSLIGLGEYYAFLTQEVRLLVF